MQVRTKATVKGKVVTLAEIVGNNIPREDILVIHDHTFAWMDSYISELHTAIIQRPARICREYRECLACMIDFTYIERTDREKAKKYVEDQLTRYMNERDAIDDNLQRIESELSMTCDPRRILQLNKTKRDLMKMKRDDAVNNGKVVEIDGRGPKKGDQSTAA